MTNQPPAETARPVEPDNAHQTTGVREWFDIAPADAAMINLATDLTITAPLNENGERCPWPWDPQQLLGAPLGQYRCPYCMAMVVAGMRHVDYAPQERLLTADNAEELAKWCGGRRAGGAFELVAVDGPEGTVYARPGDTIRQGGYGDVTVAPAAPVAGSAV